MHLFTAPSHDRLAARRSRTDASSGRSTFGRNWPFLCQTSTVFDDSPCASLLAAVTETMSERGSRCSRSYSRICSAAASPSWPGLRRSAAHCGRGSTYRPTSVSTRCGRYAQNFSGRISKRKRQRARTDRLEAVDRLLEVDALAVTDGRQDAHRDDVVLDEQDANVGHADLGVESQPLGVRDGRGDGRRARDRGRRGRVRVGRVEDLDERRVRCRHVVASDR